VLPETTARQVNMRRAVRSVAVVLIVLLLCLLTGSPPRSARADAPAGTGNAAEPIRHKAIVVGNVAINPYDIVAVFRPIEQQGVAVYVGRPGRGMQAIILRDTKDAAAVFNEIWDNPEVTKDPGDDDARPLTRMCPKDAEHKSSALIANVNRVLAVQWSADHRHVRVYLDKLVGNEALADPNGNDPNDALEIDSVHAEAENVMAAYKACIIRR
jgi:hypothetical protein